MAAFIAHNIAPIMFAALVVFLLLGYPVAFALGACGLAFFVIGVELAPLSGGTITLSWPLLQSLPDRIYGGVMANDVLLAIPFFTFMGLVLERSGMAEDLLDTIGQLFGTIRGGLAYAVIFVGALLAATTGVVAASVISMGLISLPIMLRYGYDRRLASGVIAASGTLAQIIPPSLVLIVLADQLAADVGSMYEGAFVPGVVLSALYASYVFLVSTFYPAAAPGLPPEDIAFKETDPAVANRLSRANAIALLAIIAAGVMFAGGSLKTQIVDGLGGGWGAKIWAVILIGFLAWLALSVVRLVKTLQAGGDERGLLSLLTLTIVASVLAYLYMTTTKVGAGADFVILTMSVGVAVAFLIAVANWICSRFLGFRFLSKLAQQVTFVMVPPLALIFLVLGTIFIGVATPTEGGAMGATGALLLAAFKRYLDNDPKRFNWTIIRQATESTAKLSAFVIFILIGARIFSLTFYGVNGHVWVEEHLKSLPGGFYGFLILINLAVFLLAFFLDFFELAFIVIPLIRPAAEAIFTTDPTALEIARSFNLTTDAEIKKAMIVWFGVMMGVNMQTSFMHPPFGFALFYLRSVAPKEPYKDRVTGKMTDPVTTGQIYWGAVPFVVIQLIMVTLVMLTPSMVITKKPERPAVDPSKALEQLNNLGGGIGAPGGGGLDIAPPKF
ncbi:MAG TPA: TRAP transporter large permease subunit [Beijerinckiaceae bacterium]|nr:TRAP transporter large permease subunit [Beijerinckiaceae bacterium]